MKNPLSDSLLDPESFSATKGENTKNAACIAIKRMTHTSIPIWKNLRFETVLDSIFDSQPRTAPVIAPSSNTGTNINM